MSIEAVVFDYGGVLTTPVRDSITAWTTAEGIRPESLTAALREWLGREAEPGTPIHRLETGELSGEGFGALLADRLTTYDGSPVRAEELLARLFAGMRPDPAMLDLAADLRTAGVRTALLSNSWERTYPDEVLTCFAPVVISGDVGLRKPDPAIYELMLGRLGLPGRACVFVDDAAPNLAGARAVGMHPLLHSSATATRAALVALIPALGGGA